MRQHHKRQTIAFVLVSAAVGLLVLPSIVTATTVTDDEMATARHWVEARFDEVGEPAKSVPPFSFTYGGRSSAELLPSWKQTRRIRKLDDQIGRASCRERV